MQVKYRHFQVSLAGINDDVHQRAEPRVEGNFISRLEKLTCVECSIANIKRKHLSLVDVEIPA